MMALLRGINVGGRRKVSMPELCLLASKVGLKNVRTYIQSGNLVFDAGQLTVAQIMSLIEKSISDRFGFSVDVIVRPAHRWRQYAHGSPFPDAERNRPSSLMLGLSKTLVAPNAADHLQERAKNGERIKVVDDALWIDFPHGVARSKLSPAVLDRAVGSSVTLRNWKTVKTLSEMLGDEQI